MAIRIFLMPCANNSKLFTFPLTPILQLLISTHFVSVVTIPGSIKATATAPLTSLKSIPGPGIKISKKDTGVFVWAESVVEVAPVLFSILVC